MRAWPISKFPTVTNRSFSKLGFSQLSRIAEFVLYGKIDPLKEITMAQRLTSADIKGLFEKCNNWGKWGKEDQRGAMNYITEKQIARAAKLVQSGETASCALPLPVTPAADN